MFKIPTFKQFLKEDPLPFDQEDIDILNTTGRDARGNLKLSFSDMKRKFLDKFGTQIARGSSRIVFQIDVPIEMFMEYTLTDLQIAEGQTTQPTVIKLAMNSKGIQQNIAEKQVWHEVERSYEDVKQYFCPILDWAGNPEYKNNYQYSIDFDHYISQESQLGLTWLQMPLAQKVSKAKLEKIMEQEFGPNSHDQRINKRSFDLYKFTRRDKKRNYYSGNDREKLYNDGFITDEQYDRYNEFLDFVERVDVDDFVQAANWGILNGKPVLLDYGYDNTTSQIYWDKKDFSHTIHLDKDGRIVSTVRKKQRRY